MKEELEEKLMISQVFSMVEGNQPSTCLLDLAEFDTMDVEVEEDSAELRAETGVMDRKLMAWLEQIPPIQR